MTVIPTKQTGLILTNNQAVILIEASRPSGAYSHSANFRLSVIRPGSEPTLRA
jgi:hypothetical protein